MIKPFTLNPSKTFFNKPAHTNDGVRIGNIYDINDDLAVIKIDITINTVYYHVPIQKIREWDSHAIWLTVNYKESKIYVFLTHNRNLLLNTWHWNSRRIFQRLFIKQSLGVSLTSYISRIINTYLERNSFEPKVDLVMLPHPLVKELFNNLTAQQTISMAKGIAKNTLSKSAVKKKKYAIDIRHIVSKEDDDRSINGTSRNNCICCHKFILRHNVGQNCSPYYKTILDYIFTNLLQKHICNTTTYSMVAFEFEE